jgi:hypothetical protein
LVALLPGCAHIDQSDEFFTRWGVRGAGALASFALHELCHIAMGQAMGAHIDASWQGTGPYLEFEGLSRKEHQTISIMGNACTGLAAELIVDTGKHKTSNLAWGAAAFHAVNAFGYAFSNEGDAKYWEDSGGTRESWQLINAGHSSRIAAHLAWDSPAGEYLRERWRFGKPEFDGPLDQPDPLDFTSGEQEDTPVVLLGDPEMERIGELPPVSLQVDLDEELPPVSLPAAIDPGL